MPLVLPNPLSPNHPREKKIVQNWSEHPSSWPLSSRKAKVWRIFLSPPEMSILGLHMRGAQLSLWEKHNTSQGPLPWDHLLWACFSLRLKQIMIYACLTHPEPGKCFSLSLSLVWLLFFRTWRGSNPWNLLHSSGVPLISVEFRQSRLPPCRGSQRARLGAQARVEGPGPGKWGILSNVCCHRPSKLEMFFLQTEYFSQDIRFLCLKGDL